MTRWWQDPRVRPRRLAVGGFLLVAAGALVVVRAQQPRAELARDGELVVLASSALPGDVADRGPDRTTEVVLPRGTLTLHTTEPMTELDAGDLADADRLADHDRELTAPRGSVFLPLRWDELEDGGLADVGWVEEPGQTWLTAQAFLTAPFEPTAQPSRRSARFPDLEQTWDLATEGEPRITLDDVEPDAETLRQPAGDRVEAAWERATWLLEPGAGPAELRLELPIALEPRYDSRPRSSGTVTATLDVSSD